MRALNFVLPLLLLCHTHLAAAALGEPEECAPAIAAAEMQFHTPAKLLGTIGIVESGRADPVTGRTISWPWAINAQGIDHFFASKADAIAAVSTLQGQGIRSIDVGCMQINLMYHPDAFASLDQAFDPGANALYGARFLTALYRQTGNWPQAAAAYHSQTPEIGQGYEQRVMALWPLAGQFPDPGRVANRPTAETIDYSHYTPEFIVQLKQMHADQQRLNALNRFTPEFAAQIKLMQSDLARLHDTHAKAGKRTKG